MISFFFIFLEGFFNAGMDTLQFHFAESIFSKFSFLNPSISWKTKFKLPDWVPDAFSDSWHVFKSLEILCFLLAIIFYHTFIFSWADLIILIVIRYLSFSLFYNKILIKKS